VKTSHGPKMVKVKRRFFSIEEINAHYKPLARPTCRSCFGRGYAGRVGDRFVRCQCAAKGDSDKLGGDDENKK